MTILKESLPESARISEPYSPELLLKIQCDGENALKGELDGYDCELCMNRGYTTYIDGTELRRTPCTCLDIRKFRKMAANSGVEELLKVRTFKDYIPRTQEQEGAKKAIYEYCKTDTDSWLYIGGQPGFGKTHLCVAAVGQLIKSGHAVKYIVWESEVRKILEMGFDFSEEKEKRIESMKSAPILFLDDFLRQERIKDRELRLAFEVINSRINKNLRTIISSQKTFAELLRTDEAIAGRINEKCGKYMLSIEHDMTKDYRLNGVRTNGNKEHQATAPEPGEHNSSQVSG